MQVVKSNTEMPMGVLPPPKDPIYRYRFLFSYDAVNKDPQQMQDKRTFKKGETAIGTRYFPKMSPTSKIKTVESVLMEGKYIIPMEAVEKLEQVKATIPENENIISQAKNLKNSNGFKQGAVAGLIIGGAYSLTTGRSFLLYAIGGIILFGTLGHIIIKNNPQQKN